MKTAILVDGGFYRKRAAELYAYCSAHLKHEQCYNDDRGLYRIFYYDCPPLAKTVYHPLLKRGIDFRHSETYAWTNSFFEELKNKGNLLCDLANFRMRMHHMELVHPL